MGSETGQGSRSVRSTASRWAALLAVSVLAAGLHARNAYDDWSRIPHTFRGANAYSQIGTAWARGEPLGNRRAPVYSLVYGLAVRAAGENGAKYVLAVVQGVALAALPPFLVLLALRSGAGVRAGLVAAALVMAHATLASELLTKRETWLFAWILLVLYGLMASCAFRSVGGAAALGFLCALGWLTRPSGLWLAPTVALVWGRSARGGPGVRARAAAAFVLAWLAPLLLWLGYQGRAHDALFVAGSDNAANLYKGNNEAVPVLHPWVDLDVLDRFTREKRARWQSQGRDVRREQRAAALAFVVGSPGAALALVPRKAAAFALPLYFPLGRGRAVPPKADGEAWVLADYRPFPARYHWRTLAALPGIALVLAGLRRWPRLPPGVQWTGALFLALLLTHVVTWGETRFRLPLDPLLSLAGLHAAGVLWPRWRALLSPGGPGGPVRPSSAGAREP